MSDNRRWDGITYPALDFPYNRITAELSEEPPRFIRGLNCFVSSGGKVARRPGTIAMTNGTFNLRVDRAWIYETIDTPPVVYLIVSAYNASTGYWELWYQRLSNTPSAFAQVPNYRASNQSLSPHEASVARGLLFVKGYPGALSSEKLGSVIIDGTAGAISIKPWGMLGPTTPARIVGNLTTTTADITASGTTLAVTADVFPAAPFVVQVDYEQMNVTAKAGLNFTVTRGFNGTTAAAHVAGSVVIYRGWTPSSHLITVGLGWQYSYAYKSITGHYSNRAPVETNPDNLPSTTGPFFNQQPQVTVQGTSDTTNFPSIVIFRTTDGGGTFYELDTITNTGAGAITYTDNKLTSGAGTADPIPDKQLNAASFAPSLTSNSPPPTCNSPSVVGTDAIVNSSPIAYFQARHWFAIGNILYYSANEELDNGVPEEAFPSGIKGNFFRFQFPIVNLQTTSDALYVFTLQHIYVIFGTTRETFAARPIFDNYGAPYGHARAITRFAENIAFLTHDYRVALIRDKQIDTISDPLFTDIVDQINLGAEFDIKYWADLEKQWLIVSGHISADPTQSRQWVYDLNRVFQGDVESLKQKQDDFWFVPWTYPSTAMVSGRTSEASGQRRLVFFSYDPDAVSGKFVRLDPTGRTATDATTEGNAVTFDIDLVSNLFLVPPGNHVNKLRRPGITPVLYAIHFDRTLFNGDTDPDFFYYADDLWSDPISSSIVEDPARRPLSKAYKTLEYPIDVVGQRFAWEVRKLASADNFELQTFSMIFSPDEGA